MSQAGEILAAIETALGPLITAEKGEIDIASDVEHALQMLQTAPRRFRVVITWDGYGDHPNSNHGMANSNFMVIIHQNPGLQKDPARVLHTASTPDSTSFLDRMEQVSAWMRALRFPGRNMDCDGFSLTDSQWAGDTPGNTIAHALTFSIATALPHFAQLLIVPPPSTTDS